MSNSPVVFRPSDEAAAGSQWAAFRRDVEREHAVEFASELDFHRWACSNYDSFWGSFLRWSQLPISGGIAPPTVGTGVRETRFFPNVLMNFAECLLQPIPDREDAPAVIARDETGARVCLTRSELRDQVLRVANGLQKMGVRHGDRVAAIARNNADSIIACLAATSLGATWSSTAPDLAADAILTRFAQLKPKVLFCATSHPYHGLTRHLKDKLATVIEGLDHVKTIVTLDEGELPETSYPVETLANLRKSERRDSPLERFPFDHPLFIMFSSGTTGVPKCIVHGVGGTLLEHLKEHRLHGDMDGNDRLYFQTSCGWMMWNWQLSALATGAAILVYDGSVSFPERDTLWKVVAEEKITVLGTSPPYLQYCADAGILPASHYDLSNLRALQSTGSILHDKHFDWVAEHVAKVPVQSISGGTDIIGCFVLGHPTLPVFRGECQSISLGLDVRSAIGSGESIQLQTVGRGELVCVNPFPSRPIGFFGDPDGKRYRAAYFADHEGVWTHGDAIELTDRGTARILGRSDGVMNIKGIRIGPAEIYHVLADIPEVGQALAVERRKQETGAAEIVLLVTLPDTPSLDRDLTLKIKREIKQRTSPVHVPSVICQVTGLPTTFSGKLSEKAARDAVNGNESTNRAALKNPETLDEIRRHPALSA